MLTTVELHVCRKTIGPNASKPRQHRSHVARIGLAGASVEPLNIYYSASKVKKKRMKAKSKSRCSGCRSIAQASKEGCWNRARLSRRAFWHSELAGNATSLSPADHLRHCIISRTPPPAALIALATFNTRSSTPPTRDPGLPSHAACRSHRSVDRRGPGRHPSTRCRESPVCSQRPSRGDERASTAAKSPVSSQHCLLSW